MSILKTEHTPGPWTTRRDAVPHGHVQVTIYAEASGLRVATAFEQEANAPLIAAAPDLLAACKGIFRAIESNELVRDISRDHEPDWALRMIRLTKDLLAMQQAIARAEKEVTP